MVELPEISAIICTHNRVDFLQACIESLMNQSLSGDRYEIIVVDNGSTDNTKNFCSQYDTNSNFSYIFDSVLGLSQARNSGWKQARGKYVGYIDDDAVADHYWLEKALESFTGDTELDWVGGSVTLVWEQQPPAWLTESYYSALGWVNWGEKPRFLDPDKEWLVGCNSLFKRQTLVDNSGFDTRLGRKENLLLSGEEVQLHHKIKAAGGKFYYHPGIHVKHHVVKERILPEYFYRRYYWGGITDYIMAKTLADTPSQLVSETGDDSSQLRRFVSHAFKSIGVLVPKDESIQSRIYMSYVAGHLAALVKYGLRTSEFNSQ